MREIIPFRLWLGNIRDVTIENIASNEIVAVFDLAMEELVEQLPRRTLYYRFPLLDGEQSDSDILRLAIESLLLLLKNEIPTLVFCSAGMSRSPSVTAAALSLTNQDELEDSLQNVVQGYPHDISTVLWRDIKTVVEQIRNSSIHNKG
ncbi:dual specificity protein phosphatase family protein [Adhaeretor mobilis]|uniref:Dual specificity phosphatase, catalytic domain n=1 Tax=Adhaeretor mobilis TaxID=1930276 RepID=A0A517MSE8_9BACT|nr:dual specificity protein phosphatase [Adhaeretor mobilis]QDS97717.1 Dual specificity phosphatase, catalytic domain [Adhaeretor mobilis]